MNDAALASATTTGQSLWREALQRFLKNPAALTSLGALLAIALACLIGPFLTGRAYDRVYQDYVRAPARLAPYPTPEQIEAAVPRLAARMRASVERLAVTGDVMHLTLASSRPLDQRLFAYLHRSDMFGPARVLDLLEDLKRRLGMAIIFISHDLNIVRRFANRVAVMQDGRILEHGPVADIFSRPRAGQTRRLLAAEPSGRKNPIDPASPVMLEGKEVSVTFSFPRRILAGRRADLVAVDAVSVRVQRGETLGIVG